MTASEGVLAVVGTERVETHMQANKTVTVAGLHSELWRSTSVSVYYFSSAC